MFVILSTAGVMVLGFWLARFLTEWLSNRPDPSLQHTQEEILSEIDEAFVDREALSFLVDRDSVPVLLHRLTEAVGLGFLPGRRMPWPTACATSRPRNSITPPTPWR